MSEAMQGAITQEEANRIRGFALKGEGGGYSLSASEAAFRRKVWLALAPLCEATLSKNVRDEDDAIKGITSFAPVPLESSPLKRTEASDGTQSDDTLSKSGDESESSEGRRAAKRRKVECDVLKKWYDEHESNPYPTKEEKAELVITTRLTENQINNWFATERHKKKKARGDTTAQAVKLSEEAVEKLRKWYEEHEAHPFPRPEELRQLALKTELTEKKVHTWFKCERKRRKKASGYKFKPKDRLPTAAVNELKKWYDGHESHPYPTMKELRQLALTTKLTEKQIKVWLVHERLKRKRAAGGTIIPKDRLPIEAVCKLKKWYSENEPNPFPGKDDLRQLVLTTKLTEKQIDVWFRHERAKKRDAAERALRNEIMGTFEEALPQTSISFIPNEGRLTRVDFV